jgi:hypothetical protein
MPSSETRPSATWAVRRTSLAFLRDPSLPELGAQAIRSKELAGDQDEGQATSRALRAPRRPWKLTQNPLRFNDSILLDPLPWYPGRVPPLHYKRGTWAATGEGEARNDSFNTPTHKLTCNLPVASKRARASHHTGVGCDLAPNQYTSLRLVP